MEILVIDDTKKHLNAALETLKGHDVTRLTICSSHEEADILFNMEQNSFWDVVMIDLLMPVGGMSQSPIGEKYVGQEMPVGWSLALEAIRKGAKFVAVVTDTNHHNHPASAMLDAFHGHIFQIDGAKLLFENKPHLTKSGQKDWGDILNTLVGIPSKKSTINSGKI